MRVLFLTGCLLILCGCAPELTAGNQAGGAVNNVRSGEGLYSSNMAEALALADAHCHKYGKVARINGRINSPEQGPSTLAFDCVSP